MKDRIREVREHFGLSMEKFGARIGIGKTSVSLLESGKNNPSLQTILLICYVFGISEKWLRTGEGPMLSSEPAGAFDQLAKDYSLSQDDVDFLNAYLQLPPEHRNSFSVYSSILSRIRKDRE